MSLNLPILDDLTYADLVREGVELIPRYAPKWTNHNASDPGITLVELFAYLTEIYLYRVDRVSAASKAKFLKLLVGPDVPVTSENRERQLQQAIVKLRRPFRAVSDEDFERLAIEAVRQGGHGAAVARAHSCARRNLDAVTDSERQRDRPGHVSVVFVPSDPWMADSDVQAITRTIRRISSRAVSSHAACTSWPRAMSTPPFGFERLWRRGRRRTLSKSGSGRRWPSSLTLAPADRVGPAGR